MFTPTQIKILDILSDGLPHTREELHGCLPDDMGELSNIQPHISNIRKVLRKRGEDIVCIAAQGYYYQHVRLLPSAVNGKR